MQTEFGWLIEDTGIFPQPHWLQVVTFGNYASVHWTTDANLALRFARRQDAEAFMLLHGADCASANVVKLGFSLEKPAKAPGMAFALPVTAHWRWC
ncbi:MAG TPA: hypothetical protein VFH85_00185 [Gammaproteobacteria bacterium]|nr:hypothetical protein [Gammaproteobacteria bacterium]